ncbi:ComEA family DNA-binding protein [Pseudomonas sp. N040]|uniref:ComEA family DNA-binding protein n=1 Tax=Pseudomonas sp. N040 TaxID=2785325 RepID=UPI0018A33504|nr:helix-hairpin-helix domain-containing protein [Pseudomonas sp. N040]MBF7729302.1 helix-hairpin-helix domain-containing protein [Pseudomonas sp. N040]MBW7012942.1 helix-hairpin-helix domain-containing protein [Pseudomonas sp. N040]
MRKFAFAYLLCSLLSGVSVAATAATGSAAQAASTESVQPAQAPAAAQAGVVNLNTADEATLERELIGVGAVKAKAIVEYRAANGPFSSVDELLEVKGIGAATLDKNRDRLSIN